jgi:putative heme-binding domain-containing protein
VDVDFVMAGVEAELNVHNAGAPARPEGRVWMPAMSPETSVELGRGSAAMEKLVERLGAEWLQADVALMCKLDLPGKRATVEISAERPFSVQAQPEGGVVNLKVDRKTGDRYAGRVEFATDGRPVPFVVDVDMTRGARKAGGTPAAQGPTGLMLTYTTDQSATPRPIPLERMLPTWAPEERQPVVKEATASPLTQGGDWEAGRALFFGEAKCSTCHTVRGEGGRVGPNLSNLVQINPESVLKDIVEPSARINPDHVSYIIETKAGDTLSGLVRQEGDRVIVSEAADRVTTIAESEVREIRPSKVSLMPEGYGGLGEGKLRDLVTFLTVEKGKK